MAGGVRIVTNCRVQRQTVAVVKTRLRLTFKQSRRLHRCTSLDECCTVVSLSGGLGLKMHRECVSLFEIVALRHEENVKLHGCKGRKSGFDGDSARDSRKTALTSRCFTSRHLSLIRMHHHNPLLSLTNRLMLLRPRMVIPVPVKSCHKKYCDYSALCRRFDDVRVCH